MQKKTGIEYCKKKQKVLSLFKFILIEWFVCCTIFVDAHKRWNEENRALVESHQKYLQELTIEYEEKLLAEQHKQKQLSREKEALKVWVRVCSDIVVMCIDCITCDFCAW